MKNNIVTHFVLISLCFSNFAIAHTETGPTAETTLLTNAISLQGEALAPNQLQQNLKTELQNYAKHTADETSDARVARLQTALVDLSITTPAQATIIVENIRTVLNAPNIKSDTDEEQLLRQLTPILESSSNGAQFSACAESFIALGVSSAIAAPLAYLQNTDHNSLTYGTIAGLLVLLPLLNVMASC